MKRRVFLGAMFCGMGLRGTSGRAAMPATGGVPSREFGKTGVRVTVVGQGGARLPLMRTRDEARKHVQHAYNLGINYFDCAHSYWEGRSEEVYGEALAGFRKEIFLTSKTTQRSRDAATEELDRSLRRLKTDYLDLWQIHGVNTSDEVRRILGPGGAIESFEAARQQGKCRFIGITGHHDPNVLVELLQAYDRFDSILMPLHAADPSYLSFEKIALPLAVQKGIAVQAMKVFGNAFLLRALNPRECLEYALSLPVHCAAVGCSTIGQLEENIRIAREFKHLSSSDMDVLRERAVKGTGVVTGTDLEYWKKS